MKDEIKGNELTMEKVVKSAPDRPTIALVVPDLSQGGGVPAVARFVKDTIQRAGRFNLEVVSLAMSSRDVSNVSVTRPATWRAGARTSSGIWNDTPFTHVGAIGGELEFQRYLPRDVLRRVLKNSDLIQVVSGSPACANAVCGLGKPVAVQCATRAYVERKRRDWQPRGLIGWWRKGMTGITNLIDDRALAKVDAIQVENLWMYKYAEELNVGRDVDLRYAPPGLDSLLFRPSDEHLETHDTYILCVGRLSDPRKNVGLLLEAFALIPVDVREKVRLVLAGSSGPTDEFWVHAQLLGVRKGVSYVENPDSDTLLKLYQRAAVFALPSEEEGLGIVILEAMACGVPVVATRSGGPEGIITDFEDGFLVPLANAAAMSARLMRLLQDATLRENMGRKARQTIEQRYDERVAGEVYIDMWDRLAFKAGLAC